ncbi:MAG: GTPase Era [Microscillaceae bacterium]|nr:GTPase Era [Microscillaceae bacterium]
MADAPQAALLHKAGFVSIIGKPNVGKSTLMNQMVGERLSIITPKAQTTRHRIMGILNGEDFQIVYSDTPGIIEPKYALHQSMMHFVRMALEDADVLIWLTDIHEKHDESPVQALLQNVRVPVFLLINKIDLSNQAEVEAKVAHWEAQLPFLKAIIPLSARENFNVDTVLQQIKDCLPEHPPFFSKDEVTDKPARFFASEIIREKIFLNYKQEIPYSSEVVITAFKEVKDIIRISAEIMVERVSQKGILIGKGGASLKKVGIEARQDLEAFFGKQVFLEQFVKVEERWRNEPKKLKRFGYSGG